MRVYVLVPWSTTDTERERFFAPLISRVDGLVTQITGRQPTLLVRVNGLGSRKVAATLQRSIPAHARVLVSGSEHADKSDAVRWGGQIAIENRGDMLLVVDNDLRVTPEAVHSIIAAYRASPNRLASALKRPLITAQSTDFQRTYAFAVDESFRWGMFPKRATGSFYALDPSCAEEIILPGHAESDLLAKAGALPSGAVVYSEHSADMEGEIRRRARHWQFAEGRSHARLHSHPAFLQEALALNLLGRVDPARFRTSVYLWDRVHRLAEQAALAECREIVTEAALEAGAHRWKTAKGSVGPFQPIR